MELFSTLSPSRPVHFNGPGFIPFTEIEAFCRLAGFEPAEHLEIARALRAVDLIYLELLDKRKAAGAALPQPPKGEA